jgi:hypothetical protein
MLQYSFLNHLFFVEWVGSNHSEDIALVRSVEEVQHGARNTYAGCEYVTWLFVGKRIPVFGLWQDMWRNKTVED